MTFLPLDHLIFGNGQGFASPYFDNRFYWLGGELYTFNNWLGAQLHSVQWTHPKPSERRRICGQTFRPFQSRRRWGRVYVSWQWCEMPGDLNEANAALMQFSKCIGRHDYWPAPDTQAQGEEK